MTLADVHLRELDDSSLTENERASMHCRAAAECIVNGRFQAAAEALGGLWRGVGIRPKVEALDERTSAEVLQQVGALSGWLGASRQAEGAQDAAKDLLSESVALFEKLGDGAKAAFARSELALCYWREGAYDEARILLNRASKELAGADADRQATVLLRLVTVECAASRLHDALIILKECAQLLEASQNDALRGSFHGLHAATLRRLGTVEGHGDYYDRAIIEYTAAIYHYERAGHARYAALIENNLAFLLYKLGRYADAHEHLDPGAWRWRGSTTWGCSRTRTRRARACSSRRSISGRRGGLSRASSRRARRAASWRCWPTPSRFRAWCGRGWGTTKAPSKCCAAPSAWAKSRARCRARRARR